MASSLDNNGEFNIPPTSASIIQLRANTGGTPLSHDDVDSNFENLRLGHNAVVLALGGKASATHAHDLATADNSGFMSSAMFTKLDGIAENANNYSLEAANAEGKLGGVTIGANINVSGGEISVPLATTLVPGVVEYDGSTIKKNTSGQLYVDVDAVNTNTTYDADEIGLTLDGTTFKHKDTSSQANIALASRTYINGLTFDEFGHVTGYTSATETVLNSDTTYSADGVGITLDGTTFKHANTSDAASVNNSGNTVIQDITLDQFGHITALTSTTVGSAYSKLEQLSDGTILIADGDGAASLIIRKTGTGAGGAALFIDTDSTADGDLAAIELRGGVNLMAWRDDAPTTSSNTALALQADVNQGNTLRQSEEDFRYFNLVNSNGKFGLDSVKADNTKYASMFEFYPIKAVDGADGAGGAYNWSNGLPHWTQFRFNGAMQLGGLDTSDVIGQMVVNEKDTALYCDQGSNLVFRQKNGSGNTAARLYISGHADDEASVATNVALHLASDKYDTPTSTLGFRNTGRSINYPGTSDPNIEIVGTNIKSYQTAIQTQKNNLRTSITLQYEPADSTQSNYSTGTQTGLSGAPSGEFAGLYLTGAYSGQQRSLRPSGWFDGAMNLGDANTRWSTVYATGGTINTSDRNVKQDIEDLSDAEKSVAVALKGLIKKYRFKDAVGIKGDDARIHVGVIAQDVEQAFADAGLDGFRYGILCKDTVYKVMLNGKYMGFTQGHNDFVEDAPDGEQIEGATLEAEDRYAVRYEELLAFIISAL